GTRQPPRREVRLAGRIAPGSRFGVGASVFLLYDWPAPFPSSTLRPGQRAWSNGTILEVTDTGVRGGAVGVGDATGPARPRGMTPGWPPDSRALKAAIAEWAAPIPATVPALPSNPAMDVLRRLPPRAAGG